MLTAELHTHSEFSYDGRDAVDMLLEQASAIGLDAIAVTDHDEIEGSLRAVELAEDYDILAIPGIEVTSRAGHVLGLGVDTRIESGLPYDNTINRIRDAGGIAVIPHPFQESRHGVMASISRNQLAMADAIEVYNSRLFTGRGNRQARRFAEERGLPMTAGSDAHVSEMVGQARTLIDAEERSVEAILSAIRDGRTEIEGKRTPWLLSFRQFAGGTKRRVRRTIESML